MQYVLLTSYFQTCSESLAVLYINGHEILVCISVDTVTENALNLLP